MEIFTYLVSGVDIAYQWVWSLPLLLLILGLGGYLTFLLRGFPFRYLGVAIKAFFLPAKGYQKDQGDISPFQSIMTALAASLGIANIAGVATAVTIGGWGALFWMWITALLGMAIKYAEALLAIRYRTVDAQGEMCGGPMVFIEKALGWRSLATLFAVCGSVAAFGGGNILQANSVADVLHSSLQFPPLLTGILLLLLTGITLFGGIRSIGKVASYVVPFMALFYIGGTLAIILPRIHLVPQVLLTIFHDAFTGEAATGGFVGATLLLTIQTGVSRGLMTSEAGLGTASIAAAAAKTHDPSRQALAAMAGSFLATLFLCTLTGLTLGVTGILDHATATGATLTKQAFASALPHIGAPIVTISLLLFAFTTLLGWAYYGEKCIEYLLGTRSIPFYRIFFSLCVIPGATLDLHVVWKLSDISNGIMAIPNLIALVALAPVVARETRQWQESETTAGDSATLRG